MQARRRRAARDEGVGSRPAVPTVSPLPFTPPKNLPKLLEDAGWILDGDVARLVDIVQATDAAEARPSYVEIRRVESLAGPAEGDRPSFGSMPAYPNPVKDGVLLEAVLEMKYLPTDYAFTSHSSNAPYYLKSLPKESAAGLAAHLTHAKPEIRHEAAARQAPGGRHAAQPGSGQPGDQPSAPGAALPGGEHGAGPGASGAASPSDQPSDQPRDQPSVQPSPRSPTS